MKQIFDWIMEQMHEYSEEMHDWDNESFKVVEFDNVENIINEAEAKWEKEHKPYDVEKVLGQIKDYFCKVIDACEEDIIQHDILEYNKAICEIVRKGGVE